MDLSSPYNTLDSIVKSKDKENAFSEFFKRMKRKNEDCPEQDDCDEITSSCCNAKVVIMFGSYPLKVKCTECDSEFFMKDIVAAL